MNTVVKIQRSQEYTEIVAYRHYLSVGLIDLRVQKPWRRRERAQSDSAGVYHIYLNGRWPLTDDNPIKIRLYPKSFVLHSLCPLPAFLHCCTAASANPENNSFVYEMEKLSSTPQKLYEEDSLEVSSMQFLSFSS